MSILSELLHTDKSTKAQKPKETKQILNEQIEASLKEFDRSNKGLFLSAFTAGLEVGFSVLFMGTIFTLFGQNISPNVMKVLLALCYPVGFIFVIIGRSELFTEHTALAILPVLKRSVGLKDLFILWGLVYAGNLFGGLVFSFIISKLGTKIGFVSPDALTHMAEHLIHHDWSTIFLSALLAGWMMGLLGWLITSSQDTMSRIFVIILVTSIIGVAGLHHCIVGSIEVLSGLFSSDSISFQDYLKFQSFATLGNIIGGSVFVSILKFSNIRE